MQMWDYNIHLHISPLMTHTKQLPHLTTTALLRPNTTVNHSSDTAYRRNEERKEERGNSQIRKIVSTTQQHLDDVPSANT